MTTMMRNCYRQVLLLALLFCNPHGSSGFSAIHGRCHHRLHRSTVLRASGDEIADAETGTGRTTTLELKGAVEVATGPLPRLPSEELASFLASTEVRDLLVTAGGKRRCEELRASSGDILEEWRDACEVVGAHPPDEGDSPLSVRTGGIDLPGLRIVSTAKIGAKLVQGSSPRYEFVLIGDEQTVSGLPPVVWIYNKLTGSGGSDDGKSGGSNSSTSSLTTVSCDETEDGKTIIRSNASLSIDVNFPSVLLKILPTNKEKAEETGGNAVSKTLEKDVKAAMEAVEKAYLKLLETAK